MVKVYERPKSLIKGGFHYCPGCGHGIIQRLVAEIIDELNIQDTTIGVAPIGCAAFVYTYFDIDMIGALHGRGPAVATGIKRTHPDKAVFTYQGDGDLAAIGTAEFIHAVLRGEKITTIFVNNAVFGMTGGQMAPTTLLGQKTTTCVNGRDSERDGFPFRVCETISSFPGVAYLSRVSVHNVAEVRKAKRAIKKAFQVQIEKKGYSLVEVISPCPTNWGLKPPDAYKWIEEKMIPHYPLKEFVSK